MNRRKAIGTIILTGIGGGLLFGGFEWYRFYSRPDFAFAEQNSELIASLADSMIPTTPDSPGAREAGVTPFIQKMLRECMDRPSANNFIAGLHDIDSWCHHQYSLPFKDCSDERKRSALTHFEQRDKPFSGIAGKIETHLLGAPFFATLKNCTAIAYCTSQLGATKGLSYSLIPGSFRGCIPKLPGQTAWATK
jgi:hypothetical protein